MNVNLLQNINPYRDSWSSYGSSISEVLPELYKSTNASFYMVVRIIQLPTIFESSAQALDRNLQEELFLNKTVIDKKKNDMLTTTPVDHLKALLGINVSETAGIIQVTRQAIYDWKSRKAIPSAKNQERINKLITICKKWESENLGPIRHLIRQNIWSNDALFDLLCKDDLDEELIYAYFDKIKAYMVALNKERKYMSKTKEQYRFKQLSDRDKFEKLKKNSRKIG